MSADKDLRRLAKANVKNARAILSQMEQYIDGKDEPAKALAYAFFHVLGYHLELGDLRPSNVHLAALLRGIE